jgi:hypothetical protein
LEICPLSLREGGGRLSSDVIWSEKYNKRKKNFYVRNRKEERTYVT